MNSTEEKVMRVLKKLNVSYNPVMNGMCRGSSNDTTANKINPYFLIG